MLKTVVFQDQKINYDLTHKNIKNINMRIKSNGIISVSCPYSISDKDIERFVLSNADRILKVLKKLESERIKRAISQSFTDGDIFYIFGDEKKILNITSSKTKAYVLGETLIIEAPEGTDSIKKKKALLDLLKELCKEETANSLEKMSFFFKNEKTEPPQISFRKMKTRWGSCIPSKKKIYLNTLLACAPVVCFEYVVLHELAHLLYPNHSKAFYNYISQYMPDHKERKKLLSQYGDYLLDF